MAIFVSKYTICYARQQLKYLPLHPSMISAGHQPFPLRFTWFFPAPHVRGVVNKFPD